MAGKIAPKPSAIPQARRAFSCRRRLLLTLLMLLLSGCEPNANMGDEDPFDGTVHLTDCATQLKGFEAKLVADGETVVTGQKVALRASLQSSGALQISVKHVVWKIAQESLDDYPNHRLEAVITSIGTPLSISEDGVITHVHRVVLDERSEYQIEAQWHFDIDGEAYCLKSNAVHIVVQ